MNSSDHSAIQFVSPVLITVDQVATMLQVSTRTVWRMRSSGELPAPVRVAGGVRWRHTDVELWIKDGCPAK